LNATLFLIEKKSCFKYAVMFLIVSGKIENFKEFIENKMKVGYQHF